MGNTNAFLSLNAANNPFADSQIGTRDYGVKIYPSYCHAVSPTQAYERSSYRPSTESRDWVRKVQHAPGVLLPN